MLSMYSLLVEMKAEENPNYVAYCDINEHISCTKAFTSEYGKGFGILGKVFGEKSVLNQPNPLIGMIFYTLFFFLNMLGNKAAIYSMIGLGALSNVMSLYLGYILMFILKDFCFICVATYVVNATLLFFSIYKKNVAKLRKVESNVQNGTAHKKQE